MFFAFLVLITALAISATAAYYSIVGLMAIFSGATLSVAVMGSVLEVGKLVTASWLYQYWKQVPFLLKTYLTIAVFVLMLITSMGIFGYLSKAYLEQSAMSEEQIAQIQVYTEKLDVRVRGRTFAMRVEATEIGTAFKLGSPQVNIVQDGRR